MQACVDDTKTGVRRAMAPGPPIRYPEDARVASRISSFEALAPGYEISRMEADGAINVLLHPTPTDDGSHRRLDNRP